MEIIRPIAFGSVIIASMFLLGCDVRFQRNSEHLHQLRIPIQPNAPVSPGQLGRQYDFEIARANFGGIMMPNVNLGEADEHVDVRLKRFDDGRWEFAHGRSRKFPEDDLRHDINRPVLRLTDRQVFPYYGHLFRFSTERELVHLDECTHQFPAELLPGAENRVLMLNQSEATFSHTRGKRTDESSTREDSFETIQLVKIDSQPDRIQATILRKPMIVRRVEGDEQTTAAGDPKEEQISTGANLVINDQLIRVKRIVPPSEVDGAGSLIGWIEFEKVDLSEVEMHRVRL